MKIILRMISIVLFFSLLISSLTINSSADKVKIVDNTAYRYSDNNEEIGLMTGWVKGRDGNLYYYKNGKYKTGLVRIDKVVYRFNQEGVLQGKFTGIARLNGVRVYYRDGKQLKYQKSAYMVNGKKFRSPDLNSLLKYNCGGWIKIRVHIDKIYSVIIDSQFAFEGRNVDVYVPYNLAPVIYDADGLYMSDIIISRYYNADYTPFQICPIVNNRLQFFDQNNLINPSYGGNFNEIKETNSSIEKDGQKYIFKDGITTLEMDQYFSAFKSSEQRQEEAFRDSYENDLDYESYDELVPAPKGFTFRCTIISF